MSTHHVRDRVGPVLEDEDLTGGCTDCEMRGTEVRDDRGGTDVGGSAALADLDGTAEIVDF